MSKKKFIKDKSFYTIKKHHVNTPGGTIYENDYMTIVQNDDILDEVLLYPNSKFKIKIRTDENKKKRHVKTPWLLNESGSSKWTKNSLPNITEISEESKIVLKPNYSSLNDFAYFGSAVELIRATVNDIIKRFPGGLCYYEKDLAPKVKLDNTTYYYVSNECQIDCWSDGVNNIKQDETFVLGVDGSNMDNIFDGDDMARVKLVRSFKNNKEATLEYLKRSSSSLKGILTKEIINEYIDNNHDFLIDEDNVDLVVAQPYLIAVSLRNNPEYTFKKIEECRIHLYGISPRDIIEVLGPNFVIDTNSARLVKIWPEVAEVSLKNDYAQTLSVLSDMSQSGLTNSRAYDLYRTIKPILQSNNFCLLSKSL